MKRRSKPLGRLVLVTFALTLIFSLVLAAVPAQAETDDVSPTCSGCELSPLMSYSEERTLSANKHVTWVVYMEQGFIFEYQVKAIAGGPMEFYIFNATQYAYFEDNDGPYDNLTWGVAEVNDPLSGPYLTTDSGEHYIVLLNTGASGSFEIQSNVDLIDIWGLIELVCMVCVGIVVLIVGLIIIVVIVSRKKKRGRKKEDDDSWQNVSYSLDDQAAKDRYDSRDGVSQYDPRNDIDDPYKRDKFFGKRR